jgi:uroporphyrin-III C-methyltransferase / precorrin-2 dehydrogenase / sirohydrochlorin ferrochelatase
MRNARVLLAGDGGPGLVWKCELLLAAGAHVSLFLADMGEADAFSALATVGRLNILLRQPAQTDFDGVVFALGDFTDLAAAQTFAALARSSHVLVNLVDRPALSDVQFGAIVDRSPITVAIATDGKAPSLGRAIRGRIEAMLPPNIGQWAEAADQWRDQAAGLPPAAKRKFWSDYAALALANATQMPSETLVGPLLLNVRASSLGALVIIETEPKDRADQITLEALRYLQRADVVIIGNDATADILDYARREALHLREEALTSTDIEALQRRLSQGECIVALQSSPVNAPSAAVWAALLDTEGLEVLLLRTGGRKQL